LKKSDKTICIGIIGTGFARTTQIPGFRDCMGARVVAIASRNRAHAESVAHEFDIENVVTDWRDLIAREEIDLISIVTPPALHCEMTLAALEQGKAVLCEKPMAMNAHEALQMTERAREAGVLALIDHELRFLKSRRTMRAMLHSGAIGTVRHCNYLFRSDYRGLQDQSWDWWSDQKMGGGTLGAIGSHVVDSFRWMLGTEIASVCAMLTTHITNRPDKTTGQTRAVTSDDEAKLFFRFTDSVLAKGTTGTALLSVVEPGRHANCLELYGSTGALMIEETGELWHSPSGSGAWRPVQVHQDRMAPGMRPASWSRGFATLSCQIVEALRAGEKSIDGAATFDDGYRVQLVLDAARESNQTRGWVDVS
jgi:predicted dehydrogenase